MANHNNIHLVIGIIRGIKILKRESDSVFTDRKKRNNANRMIIVMDDGGVENLESETYI